MANTASSAIAQKRAALYFYLEAVKNPDENISIECRRKGFTKCVRFNEHSGKIFFYSFLKET